MISNCQRRVRVAVEPLEEFFERVRCELSFPPRSVTVRLVGDAAMARLNRIFRGKSGPTDVLSFPANERRKWNGSVQHKPGKATGRAGVYVGDIAIAPLTARRNARRFSRSLPLELRILILHGMLHLAGYDHEADQGQMEKRERELRGRLGLLVRS